jgi:hypothetical protein
MPEYFVTVALIRGTIRWARGQCTRQQLRRSMKLQGWREPYVSNYLDMVKRAMREELKGAK